MLTVLNKSASVHIYFFITGMNKTYLFLNNELRSQNGGELMSCSPSVGEALLLGEGYETAQASKARTYTAIWC